MFVVLRGLPSIEGTADLSATLGMTKERVVSWFRFVADGRNRGSLGYARDDKGEGGVGSTYAQANVGHPSDFLRVLSKVHSHAGK
jgi:hypothetical protein